MSEHAINLMKAIETGDQANMNVAFDDALQAKIVDALQARKIEIATKIYTGATQQTDDAEDDVETEASDGTEEV